MPKEQWLLIMRRLWLSFKDKLTYSRQAEYLYARSQYPIPRHKPFAGSAFKANNRSNNQPVAPALARTVVTVTPSKTKDNKNKGKSNSAASPKAPSSSKKQERKVKFGVAVCISDLANKYNIKSNMEACKPDCQYTHYDDLPSNLTAISVIDNVKKAINKLNLSEAQSKNFLRKNEADSKFK
jgi:hypothetical protein